jgi:hypothetical protein
MSEKEGPVYNITIECEGEAADCDDWCVRYRNTNLALSLGSILSMAAPFILSMPELLATLVTFSPCGDSLEGQLDAEYLDKVKPGLIELLRDFDKAASKLQDWYIDDHHKKQKKGTP